MSRERTASFFEKIAALCRRDRRYHPYAYAFVRRCVSRVCKRLESGPGRRHIGAHDLLEGVRELASEEFGRLAKGVLNDWGVHRTEDIGEIVFNMFDVGLLGRSARDKRSDFAGGYDFQAAFVDAYPLPTDLGDWPRWRRRTLAE